MSFESDFRTFVLADPGILEAVEDRMYPVNLPQNPTLPALTYERISTERGATHDGPDGIQQPTICISCHATTSIEARDLANKVRLRLNGFVGTMGVETVVQAVFMENDGDNYQSDPGIYVSDLDFEIWAEETV